MNTSKLSKSTDNAANWRLVWLSLLAIFAAGCSITPDAAELSQIGSSSTTLLPDSGSTRVVPSPLSNDDTEAIEAEMAANAAPTTEPVVTESRCVESVASDGEILVYFHCNTSGLQPFSAVSRAIPNGEDDPLSFAIRELLAGPTIIEEARGLRPLVSPEVRANVEVTSTEVVINFDGDTIGPQLLLAGNSTRSAIRATASQHGHNVIINYDGVPLSSFDDESQ